MVGPVTPYAARVVLPLSLSAPWARSSITQVRTARASALTVDDPEPAATRDRYWASRFAFADTVIGRAVERGELPAGVQPRPAMDMLAGALDMRAMLTHEPLEPDLPERLADAALFGLHGPAAR